MNRKKRAKFPDMTNSFDLGDSFTHRERLKGPKSDSPKTSEYAFFKKLKASSSRKEQIPLKKTEPTARQGENIERVRNISRRAEGVNSIRNSCKLPSRTVACNDCDPFLSPVDGASKKLDASMKDVSAFDFENICSSGERIKLDVTHLRPKGTEAEEASIFSIKRQNLRQWIADNSFPEVDDLSPKGSDLISVLLRRLFPRSNLANDSSSKLPVARHVRHNTNTTCLSSPLSDAQFRKLHSLPARNMMGFEFMPRLEGFPASGCSVGSGANVLSDFRSPISCARNGHLQMKPRQQNTDFGFSFSFEKYGCLPPCTPLQQQGDHHDPAGSRTQSDFSFDFLPIEYECLPPSSPPQELGDYHELTRSQHRKELPLMLGWNSEVMPNDRNLTVTNTNSDFTFSPSIISTLDNERNLDNGFESFYTSALLDWTRELFVPLPSSYAFYDNRECGRYLLEEKKLKDAVESSPLASSHQLRTPDLLGGNDIVLSPERYYSSIMHKIIGQREWNLGKETHMPYGLDEEWKHCLSWSDPVRNFSSASYHALPCPEKQIMSPDLFREDEESPLNGSSYRRTYGHLGDAIGSFDSPCPSLDLKIALDEKGACPLLLDKSSWDEPATLTQYHGHEIVHL